MKALRAWVGVARTSLDPPQEPHYRDEVEGPSPVEAITEAIRPCNP